MASCDNSFESARFNIAKRLFSPPLLQWRNRLVDRAGTTIPGIPG